MAPERITAVVSSSSFILEDLNAVSLRWTTFVLSRIQRLVVEGELGGARRSRPVALTGQHGHLSRSQAIVAASLDESGA